MRCSLGLATAQVFRICDFLTRVAEVPHYTDAVLDSLAVHLDDGYWGPDDRHHRVHETIAFTQLVTGVFTVAADVTTTHRQLLQLQLQLLIVRPGRPPPLHPQDYCIHAAYDGHTRRHCWRYYNTDNYHYNTTCTTDYCCCCCKMKFSHSRYDPINWRFLYPNLSCQHETIIKQAHCHQPLKSWDELDG